MANTWYALGKIDPLCSIKVDAIISMRRTKSRDNSVSLLLVMKMMMIILSINCGFHRICCCFAHLTPLMAHSIVGMGYVRHNVCQLISENLIYFVAKVLSSLLDFFTVILIVTFF